jgi:hypothetical protein
MAPTSRRVSANAGFAKLKSIRSRNEAKRNNIRPSLTRIPTKRDHFAEKESRKFYMLEHVLVDEVVQLDWNMLQLCRLNWWVLRNVLRPDWQELPLAAFR